NDNTPQTKKTTSLTPATQTKAPVSSTSVSNNAPTLPVSNTDPGPEPETTAAHSISKDSSVTATPSASATTIVTKPTVITNTTPVQQTQQKSYDPNSLYDTRLGSSSPQYDTYEKNSYGAGTVTTSPK
ncbi:MAG TPA: hypothetical protein VG847_03155, partial [Chitinophagaceae bacterium]|nr:hypothetical protein [Chitinophagaceae bacterium]